MKMPAILSRDTGAKIDQARASLSTAQSRLAELERERGAALSGDDMSLVHKASAAVVQQQAIIRDLTDRIAMLGVRKREEDTAERERTRQEAVDKCIVPAAGQCADLAAELEKMLVRAGELVEAIEAKRQAINTMPPGVPRPQFYRGASFNLLSLRVGDLGSLKRSCSGIAAMVRADLDRFIAACRQEPLPAPADDDVEQEAA